MMIGTVTGEGLYDFFGEVRFDLERLRDFFGVHERSQLRSLFFHRVIERPMSPSLYTYRPVSGFLIFRRLLFLSFSRCFLRMDLPSSPSL